jgi:hypothetical protein
VPAPVATCLPANRRPARAAPQPRGPWRHVRGGPGGSRSGTKSAATASASSGAPIRSASTSAQGTEPPEKSASPERPPAGSKLSGWPRICCHTGAPSKGSGSPGSASSALGRSRVDSANGTNSAALGRSAHQSVRPRFPSSRLRRMMPTAAGSRSDGAAAVMTASASPAAAAAVHDGVPLTPGLAGGWSARLPAGTGAKRPRPSAEPVARSRARTSSGIMTCASRAPTRPWLTATCRAGAAAQTSAAASRNRR